MLAAAPLLAPARVCAAAATPPRRVCAARHGCAGSLRAPRCSPRRAAAVTRAALPSAALATAALSADAALAAAAEGQPSGAAGVQALYELAALDPATALAVGGALGPFFSLATLLFIIRRAAQRVAGAPRERRHAARAYAAGRAARIVMTWYPNIKDDAFPWVIVYAPTEPLLAPTRKLITPVGCVAQARAAWRLRASPETRALARSGVDTSPIVWVALISFMNEILLGKQGLLVLLSQKVAAS
jgi:uncharacterized protein YggT (Ycf19 family)